MEDRYKITVDRAYEDDEGEIKHSIKEFSTPLILDPLGGYWNSICYYVTTDWLDRWYVAECRVGEFSYNGNWHYKMTNGWYVAEEELGKTLFLQEDKQKAIEICSGMDGRTEL
jgi:hypothetical protein